MGKLFNNQTGQYNGIKITPKKRSLIDKIVNAYETWHWEKKAKPIFMAYAKYLREHPNMTLKEKMKFRYPGQK